MSVNHLAEFLRSLALSSKVAQSLSSVVREKFVKIGARTARHGRYRVFQLAKVAVVQALLA